VKLMSPDAAKVLETISGLHTLAKIGMSLYAFMLISFIVALVRGKI